LTNTADILDSVVYEVTAHYIFMIQKP
jgi:hypothetical protein